MKHTTATDINLLWTRGLPILRGLPRASWPLVKARLSQRATGRFDPFTAPNGYYISNYQQLISYWDLIIEHGAFVRWPEMMPARPVILDIGANYGVFGWECRRRWPTAIIYGFEPVPEWHQHCVGLGCYDHVFQVALSDAYGTVQIGVCSEWGSASILEYREGRPGVTDSIITAPTAPLDDMKIDAQFIKVDVDGSELRVVNGGRVTFTRSLAALIEITDIEHAVAIGEIINKKPTQSHKYSDWLYV